jgi:hypothetical protein
MRRLGRSDDELGVDSCIGIVLCSEKNDAMVKITLAEHDERVFAAI